MSQAEEMLNSMSEEIPVHTHPVPDTDTYFAIDPITRKIENPNRKKNVVMQYDHNSERITFELPRYIDGHDMLECTSVTVNVDNIEVVEFNEGEEIESRVNSDAPDITDLRAHPSDPEKVVCSWCISRNSTQLAGILSFHIEFKCVDSNGNVVYEWSTDDYEEIEVRARKKNGEAAVVPHADLLEQWRSRIFGAGDSVMANIAAEGEAQVAAVKAESETQQNAVELKGAQTLDSIPEEYVEVDAMAEEAVRSKGDAIICEESGESIVLRDSSNDHIRGLKVFGNSSQVTTKGYQLFNASILPTVSKGGATITNNGDGSFTVSGSGTLTDNIAALKDYTHEESVRMLKLGMLNCTLTQTMPYCYVQIRNSSTIYFGLTHSRPSYEITQAVLDDKDMYIRIGFYGGGNEEIIPGTIKPMLYMDGDGTWEPYAGGKPAPNPEYPQEIVSIENPAVNICGKNLLENKANTKTENGITFSINNDKSITINGTSTVTPLIVINSSSPIYYQDLQLIASLGCDNEAVHMAVGYFGENDEYVDSLVTISGAEDTFTYPPNAAKMRVYIFVSSNVTFDNVTIYPMIRLADNPDSTYEPYIESQAITQAYTLSGILVTSGGNYTDSDGQQWICDEIDLERGVYIQRLFGENVEFEFQEELDRYTATLSHAANTLYAVDNGIILLCDKHAFDPTAGAGTPKVNGIRIAFTSPTKAIAYHNGEALDNAYVLYPLATPIETPLTAEEIIAFKALRTNYPNTTILNDAGAWMSVKYNADTKTYVENPKVLKLADSSTGVVYELKIVDGNLTVNPIQ